ncbi:MAG: hypothetical protein AMXMBFR48_26150 [Ignavibacteriales bacterium]
MFVSRFLMLLIFLLSAELICGWSNTTHGRGLLLNSNFPDLSLLFSPGGRVLTGALPGYTSALKSVGDVSSPLHIAAMNIPRIPEVNDSSRIISNIILASVDLYIVLSMALAFLSTLGLLWYLSHQKPKGNRVTDNAGEAQPENAAPAQEQEVLPVFNPVMTENSAAALFLFGNLTLLDDEGNDITRHLAPKLKQLFLMLFVQSYLNGRTGLLTTIITATFWPELSLAEAKNNRNVSVNRIRSILAGIKGAEIKIEKSRMKLILPENFYCDLLEFRKRTYSPDWSCKKIKGLKEMLTRGELFGDCNYEWIESVSKKYREEVVRRLTGIIVGNHHTDSEKLILAECLLSQDSVNELGIKTKVQSLSSLGDHSLAKTAFDTFRRAYHSVHDTEYPKNIAEFLN